tara:strand:- start:1971 stop:2282 length:312 start_codon:yes stop_codon:yes gene_type:complete
MAKKALIDPFNTNIEYISSWVSKTDTLEIDGSTVTFWSPVKSTYANAQRVAQVEDTDFEVASPFFWVDCADNIVADEWYYDTSDSTIKQIVDVVEPTDPPTPS